MNERQKKILLTLRTILTWASCIGAFSIIAIIAHVQTIHVQKIFSEVGDLAEQRPDAP